MAYIKRNLPLVTIRDLVSAIDIRRRVDCDEDSSSSACQKPVNNDNLTIGLAVGIPVVIILVGLGFFLLRNYRKGKKEAMEHDPDFDETGEATMLPDMPSKGQTDNPFHNRNSIRYPLGMNKEAKKSTVSLGQTGQADPYLDNFVLPYQHQTGSNASLTEYARNLGEYQAYGNATPRASAYITRTRNSSFSHLTTGSVAKGQSVSPQKSHLKTEVFNQNDRSPVKSLGRRTEQNYTTVPNDSTAALNHDNNEYRQSDIESVSNSESDSVVMASGEKFAVNYENESDLALNQPINPDSSPRFTQEQKNVSNDSFDTTTDNLDAFTAKSGDSDNIHNDTMDETIDGTMDETTDYTRDVSSLGRTENEHSNTEYKNPGDTEDFSATQEVGSPFEDGARFESDHQHSQDTSDNYFSNGTANRDIDTELPTTADTSANTGNLGVPAITVGGTKSPRMSAFNLLKNDSDDEDDGDDPEKFLTLEQEEELKRMKSVYKEYFDRENSIHSKKADGHKNQEFKPDPNYPLGNLPHQMDYLRINKDLKTDTDYDKRMTTASSIYSETPIFSNEEQQFYHNQQEFASDPNFNYQQSPQQQQPPAELPPLQSLPPPSDIRQSTIQTYTDYQHKRSKNQLTQNVKQPFIPIENDQVWSSPISSPAMQSQSTFSNSQQSLPLSNQGLVSAHTIPSATQLSRSSVVMLNPVTEITKQRKFRPAGSLPKGATGSDYSLTNASVRNQQFLNANQNHQQHDSDLIPGNRKSDVRRMMNTNF